jgi:hypothetical protein
MNDQETITLEPKQNLKNNTPGEDKTPPENAPFKNTNKTQISNLKKRIQDLEKENLHLLNELNLFKEQFKVIKIQLIEKFKLEQIANLSNKFLQNFQEDLNTYQMMMTMLVNKDKEEKYVRI